MFRPEFFGFGAERTEVPHRVLAVGEVTLSRARVTSKTACEVLQNVADLAPQQRHTQTVSDVRSALAVRFCGT